MQAQPLDAVSREVSVVNIGAPSANVEAISRELDVFNVGAPSASSEAISRELSVLNVGRPSAELEAISREMNVFNLGQPSAALEAISREFGVLNFGDAPRFEAISREVSVFNATNFSAPVITQQPLSRIVDAGAVVAFGVRVSGTPPFNYQWQFNNADIVGGTNSTYLLAQTAVTNAGNYRVLVANVSGSVVSSNALLVVNSPDTNGPSLSAPVYAGVVLLNGQVISNSAEFGVSAIDPSGVSRVEFYLDETLLAVDTIGSDGFTAFWNVDLFADGPHVVIFRAFDFKNNLTTLSNGVTLSIPTPAAPTISSPVSGASVGNAIVTVSGSALKNSLVQLFRNGTAIGTPALADMLGNFQTTATLLAGTNVITARAQNRTGPGPFSSPVTVILDPTIPPAPYGVQASAKAGGEIQIGWLSSTNIITGYNVYRSTNSMLDLKSAELLNKGPVTNLNWLDVPATDRKYYYRVTSLTAVGNESEPSLEVFATADSVAPVALAISYLAETNYHAASGRYGQSLINLTLTLSEPLLTTPFFSLTPSGGQPIIPELRANNTTQYVSSFFISAATPSGVATASFSARDAAGNRGTVIQSGSQILIDTTGPAVTNLVIQPSRVLRNDSNAPIQITFTATLDAPVATNSLPQFTRTLSTTSPSPTPATAVTPGTNNRTWIVSFVLPAQAGVPTETLTLNYAGRDDLNNTSTTITPAHQFQVYQGNLPPLEAPLGLTAKALPAGFVGLNWQGVPGAVDYQIYRKLISEVSFSALTRTSGSVSNLNLPPADGAYQYVVASVRQENGQGSLSPFSNVASVNSDRLPPAAPQNLALQLVGNGILAQWSPPAGETGPLSYQMYRANPGPITLNSNTVPLIKNIPVAQVVDTSPTPFQPYYAIAAVDAAGNVSTASATEYLNAELLPPRTVTLTQNEATAPVITWTAPGGNMAGYNFLLGEDGALMKLNNSLLTSRSYTDTGFNGDERRYTVVAVDQNQQQSVGHSLRLPLLSVGLPTNAIIKRGLMNHLNYAVTNLSGHAVSNAQLNVWLGGRSHLSPNFDLAGGASRTVPVVVGGYTNLPLGAATITNTLLVTPNLTDSAALTRSGQVNTEAGQIVLNVMGSDVLRGGNARVQFAIFNPGDEEIEIITARNGGNTTSPDVRFTLLNSDGLVLSSVAMKAAIGSNIVNIANGDSVLRLGAGEQSVSPVVQLPVPASAPDVVYLQVEIDHVYYHSDRPEVVVMDGLQSRAEFPVVETSYTGAVTNVTPALSHGDQPIVISGNATLRRTGQPAAFMPLLVRISNAGFERTDTVLTDASGSFTNLFEALPGEAGGVYYVCASHPDLNDRSVQGTFTIQRVIVSPASLTLRAPFNFTQPVILNAAVGPGVTVTNLHVEYRPQDQPGGVINTNITVGLGNPVAAASPGQTVPLNLTFTAMSQAPRNGNLVLFVTSDGAGAAGWKKVSLDYQFSEANPSLRWSPNIVDTGVAPSNSVTETVTLENVGLVSAIGVQLALVKTDHSPAPAWASITTATNAGDLAVGASLPIALNFQPPGNVAQGDYEFLLQVRASNAPLNEIYAHVAVATTGVGGALFKVVDMFSASDGTNFLSGVTNALITLQNQLVSSIQTNLVTDNLGEAFFQSLPAGQYSYRVTANKHDGVNGRIWIRPGVNASQQVTLQYNLVSVEWAVVPITVQDRYEVTLTATFETEVPAPVVTIEPGVVNLPQLFAGDIYYGEFSIYNRGLIRADHLSFAMPSSDADFTYELLGAVPDHLDARQRVRIPYRLTCRQSLPGPNGSGASAHPSGRVRPLSRDDGCFNYSRGVQLSFDYICINGLYFQSGASSSYYYSYSRGCPGSGGGGPVFGGGIASGGGATYSGGGGVPLPGVQCFPNQSCQSVGQCDNQCCNQQCPVPKSWIGLISRQYEDELKDLVVKVPGGELAVLRQFYTNGWSWPDLSRKLVFSQDSIGFTSIRRYTVDYSSISSQRTVFQYRNNRIFKQSAGYLWQDKDGSWESYDLNGRLLATGKRNLTNANYVYDSGGVLVGVNDRNGNRIFTYQYAGGVPVSVTDLTGRSVQYTWTGGRLTQFRNALGEATDYRYDSAGRVTRIDDFGLAENITYDNGGYVYSVLDDAGNGIFLQYNYDANSRQYFAQFRTTGGQVDERRFDADGKMVYHARNGILDQSILADLRTDIITHANGAVTRREYDEFNNLVRETKPDGGVVKYEYELQFHQPVRITDARGAVTVMSYDGNGNLMNRIEAFGTLIARTNSWVYDADNQLIRWIDGRGNKMDYTYDINGNLIRGYDPLNTSYQTFYAYDARGNRTAMTNALGYSTLYGYDNLNRFVAETNALNYVTLYTYDGKNLVEVETGRDGTNKGRIMRYGYDDHNRRTQSLRVDGDGNEHIWQTTIYDGDGRVVAAANALGQFTTYTYNSLGQRTAISQPFSVTETSDTRFVYDEAGELYQEVDPLGTVTQRDRDIMHRERLVTEALGTDVQRTRQWGYDLNGNLTSITYSDGTNVFTTFYDYDLLNRRMTIRGAREYPRDFEYDADGNLTVEVNGRGFRTDYAYDQYNRRTNIVEEISHGESSEHVRSSQYDLLGQMVAKYDGNWNHRHYHYDALGRLTEESIAMASTNALPGPNWWTDNSLVLNRISYNPWGQPLVKSNITGGVSVMVYDVFGRRVGQIDPSGATLTETYNEMDQLTSIGFPPVSTAPEGTSSTYTRYVYDAFNAQVLISTTDRANLISSYNYDKRFQVVGEISSWNAFTAFLYDKLGRRTAVTNTLSEVTRNVFNQFNELVAVIYADHVASTHERIEYRMYDEFGRITNHSGAATYDVANAYDLAGNQISLIDGNGNKTRWDYDGRNRNVRKYFADSSYYEYGYDANGNQVSKRDARGRTTRSEFNANNMPVRIDYPSDSDVTFAYDAAGRRISMVDDNGTNTWAYDLADRILTNVQSSAKQVVSYSFDAEGRRLSMNIAPVSSGSNWFTQYRYDAAGRLMAITDHGVSETPFRYTWSTNAQRIASITYPSGMLVDRAYDTLGRVQTIATTGTTGNQLQRFTYSYDSSGQRASLETLDYFYRFSYDADRQIVSVNRNSSDGVTNLAWTFTYDAVGNRRMSTEPASLLVFGVNALNQYTSVSNGANQLLTYDANGNLLTDGLFMYSYTEKDELASASNASVYARFEYDGLGRLIKVTQAEPKTTLTNRYLYDALLPIAKLTLSGQPTLRLTRGLDLSTSWQTAGGIGGLLAAQSPLRTIEFGSDAVGNITLQQPVGDSLPYEANYGPYGLTDENSPAPQEFGFSSKEHFLLLGLSDFGRRAYSTRFGRWLNRDPIGESGGVNLYAYVQNDPVNRVDPFGLADSCEAVTIPADPCKDTQKDASGADGWVACVNGIAVATCLRPGLENTPGAPCITQHEQAHKEGKLDPFGYCPRCGVRAMVNHKDVRAASECMGWIVSYNCLLGHPAAKRELEIAKKNVCFFCDFCQSTGTGHEKLSLPGGMKLPDCSNPDDARNSEAYKAGEGKCPWQNRDK